MIDHSSQPDGIAAWRDALGLLPVPLFDDNRGRQPHVLLNGHAGNFCLDLGHEETGFETRRSHAWSADVGHYVVLGPDVVEVQRWDRYLDAPERYSSKSVLERLEQFHAYLERDKPRQELSIVPHIIQVFRSMRAILGRGASGADSLRVFLYLLACATAETQRGGLPLTEWRLPPDAATRADLISEPDWESLIKELHRGRPLEQLKPRLDLVLRHAAGHLFQEAHYEAVFAPQFQLRLGGFLPEPVKVRSKTAAVGLHFTPTALVRALVEEAIAALDPSQPSVTIFDPACGSGEFLREALRQLKLLRDERPVHLIGWDLSEAACDMANFVLAWESHKMIVQPTIRVECVDSLAEDRVWPAQVDAVLMNPPFLSWEDMPPARRADVARALGAQQGSRPDLSFVFLRKAAESLRAAGVMATIMPASFLDSDSAQPLRDWLASELTPHLIGRLGSQVLFPGALVDTACYVATKGEGEGKPAVAFWADPRGTSTTSGMRTLRRLRYLGARHPVVGEGFSIYQNPELGRAGDGWAPRPYRSWRLGLRARDPRLGLRTVGQVFHVRQGARTGKTAAFLLTREEWKALPPGEQPYFRPAVVNSSIRDGVLEDNAYVFYPYGGSAILGEGDLAAALPTYYRQYLEPYREPLSTRARGGPPRWWELSWNRTWQERPSAKLVSSYFGGPGSFALDNQGDFVVVQGFAWLPKRAPVPPATERTAQFAYLALLNSSLFGELLAATSGQVSGGQWNLSKRFVDPIPIPDFFTIEQAPSVLESLATLGARRHAGLRVDDGQVRELLAPLYGLEETGG